MNLLAGDIPRNTVANILTALQTTLTGSPDEQSNRNNGFQERRNNTSTAATVGSLAVQNFIGIYIFNFCQQYRKIIYECKHSIVYPTQTNMQAIRNRGVANSGWMADLVAHLPDKQEATDSNPSQNVSDSILVLQK